MAPRFPAKFRTFVNKHITSVEQVEVLLLLYTQPDRAWTPNEISAALRSTETSVTARLAALRQAGFTDRDGDDRYRYAARVHDDEMIALLAREYAVRRFSIIDLIFSRTSTARTFADAFRLWEESDEDNR